MTIDSKAGFARSVVTVPPSPPDSGLTFQSDKRSDLLYEPFVATPPFKIALKPSGPDALHQEVETALVFAIVDGTREGEILVEEQVAGHATDGSVAITRTQAGGISDPVDGQQLLEISEDAEGLFRLGWNGWSTEPLDPAGITDETLAAALNALPSVAEAGGTIAVAGHVVRFTGSLGLQNVDEITVDDTDLSAGSVVVVTLNEGSPGGEIVNERQRVQVAGAGTYLLSLDSGATWTAPIADDDSLAAITAALEGAGTPGDFFLEGTSDDYEVEYVGTLAGAPQPLLVDDTTLLGEGGIDEVLLVTVIADSGNYALTDGVTTSSTLSVGASGPVVTTALEVVYGAGNVEAVQDDADARVYRVSFVGDLANQTVALLSGDTSALLVETHDWTLAERAIDESAQREVIVGDVVEMAALPDRDDVSVSISTDQTPLDPGSLAPRCTVLVVASVGGLKINGLAGGAPGREITLVNSGANPFILDGTGASLLDDPELGFYGGERALTITVSPGQSVTLLWGETPGGNAWTYQSGSPPPAPVLNANQTDVLSGNVNDYPLPIDSATLQFNDADGDYTITGLAYSLDLNYSPENTQERLLLLVNNTAHTITLAEEDGGSEPQARFHFGHVLQPGETILLYHDAAGNSTGVPSDTRWRRVGVGEADSVEVAALAATLDDAEAFALAIGGS